MPGPRMPTVFFGHGSPIIAMQENETTQAWRSITESMPRPRAILSISAHWVTHGTVVTGQALPPTIHDFGGFPRAMHEFQYPAPGDATLIDRIRALLAPDPVAAVDDWGYDHGTWTVLMKTYPAADIPVVQLSPDLGKSAAGHFTLGRKLRPLRDEGVLIMGTGNIVHNLRRMIRQPGIAPSAFALNFGNAIRQAIVADKPQTVIDFERLGSDAAQSVPTPDHFWPLLYILGARHNDDMPVFATDFVEYSSIDMTTVELRGDRAA